MREMEKILKFQTIAIPAIGIKARPIKTRRDNESESVLPTRQNQNQQVANKNLEETLVKTKITISS